MNWKNSLHIFRTKVQNGNLHIFKPRSNNIIFISNVIFIIWFGTNICKSCSKRSKTAGWRICTKRSKTTVFIWRKTRFGSVICQFYCKNDDYDQFAYKWSDTAKFAQKKTQKDSLKILQKIIQNDNLQIMSRQEDIFKHPPRQRRPTAQLTRPLQTITSSRHHSALPIDQKKRKKLNWNHHQTDIQAPASMLNRCLGASWRLVKLKLSLSNPKSTTLQIASLINNGQADHTRSRRRCRRWVHRPCHDLASLGEQDTPSGISGLRCCSSGISWQRECSSKQTKSLTTHRLFVPCRALVAITNINANTKPKIR